MSTRREPRDSSLKAVLKGKTYDELAARIGHDWMAACAAVERCDPRTKVVLKSISIRPYAQGCFIVMRGRYGASDVVMMRECGRMEYAISFIAFMIHKGVWKPDRYGVQTDAGDLKESYSSDR